MDKEGEQGSPSFTIKTRVILRILAPNESGAITWEPTASPSETGLFIPSDYVTLLCRLARCSGNYQ